MGSAFAIKPGTDPVQLDAKRRKGAASFVATNTSGKPLRANAKLITDGAAVARPEWLTLLGQVERAFEINGTQQYDVQIDVPLNATPGDYALELQIAGVELPDEEFGRGSLRVLVPDVPKEPPRKVPWLLIGIAGAVAAAAIAGVTVFLLVRTVSVPNVVGQTQEEAEKALVSASLKVGNTTPRIAGLTPGGTVVEQQPVAGVQLRPDSPVDLVVARAPVQVPNVGGQLGPEAERNLVAAGLRVGSVTEQIAGLLAGGTVISQDPLAGATVPAESVVNLKVARAPVTVPNLVGQARIDAERNLSAIGLRPGVTLRSSGTQSDRVVAQSPAPGVLLPAETTVQLTVTRARLAPDFVGTWTTEVSGSSITRLVISNPGGAAFNVQGFGRCTSTYLPSNATPALVQAIRAREGNVPPTECPGNVATTFTAEPFRFDVRSGDVATNHATIILDESGATLRVDDNVTFDTISVDLGLGLPRITINLPPVASKFTMRKQ